MHFPFKHRIRLFLFRKKWRRLNSHNETYPIIKYPLEKVIVGFRSYGGINAKFYRENSLGKLIIGDFVSISPGVLFIIDGNHYIDGYTTYPLKSKLFGTRDIIDSSSKGPIIVEDEVWIGTNSIIMSGITLGKSSVIAAGSVVTKDVPPYAIVGGNPAKVIKYRIKEDLIESAKSFKLLNLSEDYIKKNMDLFYQTLSHDILKKILDNATTEKS